jgi:hypothetical protein
VTVASRDPFTHSSLTLAYFDFLGFTFSLKTGRVITLVEPARKSEEQFRDEVRAMTSRKSHCVPQVEVVERVTDIAGMGELFSPAQLHACLCAAALFLGATDAQVPAGATTG